MNSVDQSSDMHERKIGLADCLRSAEPLYILPRDDAAETVISPALGSCLSAQVMIGYFTSQSFAQIAPGLASYLRHSSEPLSIIVSPYLTAEDRAALHEGVISPEALACKRFDMGLPDADALTKHSLKCLAWLVSAGRLEMKVAIMRDALFHTKAWIFQDGRDVAVLHGSANMTDSGLGKNREQFGLARSWVGSDAARVCARLQEEFRLLWAGGDSDCIVMDLPGAIQNKLLQDYKSNEMPTEEDFLRVWRGANGLSDVNVAIAEVSKPKFQIPSWLKYRSGNYSHQGAAIDCWEAEGRRGILEMCTGSGKTLTAMVAAQRLYEQVGPLLIVVTAPYNVLLEQWSSEIKLFGLSPVDLSRESGQKGREKAIANARRRLQLGLSPT